MKKLTATIGGPEITSAAHPAAQEVERILRSIATTYHASLLDFYVDHGVATFEFDSAQLTDDMAEYFTTVTG